ncbi:hypothetical protein [Ruegeria atlantica]|uniref:Uncharacterized protein n=1 Tax=Ruegeria atlantica TaxID=81569 RepID=A0A0P1E3P5_9RHOB|nr:hypothetical protein [Ruegeria atlantica]CUH42077.1 hypothetical protein RUM4293_00963 [Ruegeria atlantica]
MTQSVSTALARKLLAGQEEQGEKPRSVLRALRLAFARTAGDRFQLPLSVIGARQSLKAQDTLAEVVDADWMLLRLGNADGMSAAICVDMGVVSAIVQVHTIGEVMPNPPTAREYTDTDAAMVAPLVEDALTRPSHWSIQPPINPVLPVMNSGRGWRICVHCRWLWSKTHIACLT